MQSLTGTACCFPPPAGSDLAGKSIRAAAFRGRFHAAVVAIKRNGMPLNWTGPHIGDEVLQASITHRVAGPQWAARTSGVVQDLYGRGGIFLFYFVLFYLFIYLFIFFCQNGLSQRALPLLKTASRACTCLMLRPGAEQQQTSLECLF